MPRFALEIEYDGSGFVGWQTQDNGLSIQQVLENAAARLTGGEPVAATAAGRTDARVHAEAQVVGLDLPRDWPPEKIREALNFHMKPHCVVVVRATLAPPGWHARFSAIGRAYRYRILNRRARPGLLEGRVWHVQHALDAGLMHEAAQTLLGRHDFSSFRAASCQAKSPVRTLDRLDVMRHGDILEFTVEARSFLHHQVRNMVGTLRLVGDGSWEIERVATVLAACNRACAGPTAPAEGLCMTAVRYATDPFASSRP